MQIHVYTSAWTSYSKLKDPTSFNPQNSNSAILELEKTWKTHYLSQHSSKSRAWYMLELDSLKLDETQTRHKMSSFKHY